MKNIIFDAHQDLYWYEQKETKTQTSFDLILNSDLKLVVASFFVDSDAQVLSLEEMIQNIDKQISEFLKIINQNKKFVLIKSFVDIQDILQNDKIGFLIHIEGLNFISDNNLEIMDYFYELGLRSIGLVWDCKNSLMSNTDSFGGLSELGKKVIAKMNDLGIVIDLAHSNVKSFFDVIDFSQKPVMVSHANSYNLCNQSRNLSDMQIDVLQEAEGVQGVFFSKKYVGGNQVTIDDVVEHFVYLYAKVPEMVMMGSDFGGITSGVVDGLSSVVNYNQLIEKLKMKLDPEAVEKIMYKNFLNFLKKIL